MPGRGVALNAIAFCVLAVYLVLGTISFYVFVEPSLNGTNGWRVYGDSDVYMDTADYIREQGGTNAVVALMSLARNIILPAFVAAELQSWTNIAIFNSLVFFAALALLARTFSDFQWYIFLPIVLVSPNTYQALFTLNKEIFVFLSAVLIARWFTTRSPVLMISLVLLSMALRWEQSLVILSFLVLLWLKVTPKHAAVVLIIGITIVYPFAMARVSADIPEDLRGTSSSALYMQINVLQSYGLYFALLLPKMIIALLSQVVRFWKPFVDTERVHDLNNGAFVLGDQISLCIVALTSWRRKLWTIESPVIYFVLVYIIIFLAAPENSPRYLYMLFVLMAAVISSPELQALRMTTTPSAPQKRHNLLTHS